MKLFDDEELSSEEIGEVVLSNEDIINGDLANEQMMFLETESIKLTDDINSIDKHIYVLESMDLDKELSAEELKTHAGTLTKLNIETGYSDEFVDVSLEAIIAGNKGALGGLNQLRKMYVAKMGENVKQVATVFTILKKYNSAKLKSLKVDIQSGELVPRKEVNADGFIKSDLLVFFKFGFKLDGDAKDLIEYMSMFTDLFTSGKYQESALKIMFGGGTTKDKFSSELFSRLKGVKFTVDPKGNDFHIGLLMRMFSGKLSLMSIDSIKELKLSGVHADIEKLKLDSNTVIKPFSTKAGLALLDYGIGSEKEINKAISNVKSKLLPALTMDQLSNMVAGSTGGGVTVMQYVLRFRDNYTNFITDKIYSMARYDKIIIKLIDATFKRK